MMFSAHSKLFCLLFFIFTFTSPSYSIPFLPKDNFTLLGDAFFRNNNISLTQEFNCSSSSSDFFTSLGFGRALYVYPIRFLDFSANVTASFACRFTFSIKASPSCSFGDGIAFLITSNAGKFDISAGHMGLPEFAPEAEDSFLAVEFDTSFNPSLGDINGNHIGVDVNKVISFASVDAVANRVDLKSGKPMTAWIEYNDALKMIHVWVGYSQVRPPSPILATQIDLSKQFKEFMHVGFSASNGEGSAAHVIDGWRFKTFGFLSSPLQKDPVGEGDCLMCSTEDSSREKDFSDGSNDQVRTGTGAFTLESGVLVALIAIVVVAVFSLMVWFWVRKRRYTSGRSDFRMRKVPTMLTLSEIRSATKGFNPNRIIGEGATAMVYEGILPSGKQVAVKRFSPMNGIDCFMTEKTDVYSFGVVVLEVATGRRSVDDDGIVAVDFVWGMWERRKLLEAADSRLRGKFDMVGMQRMLKVGLCCVNPNCEKRPTVKEAARMLRGEVPVPVLPARKPTMTICAALAGDSERDGGDENVGVEDQPWMTPMSRFS
ncbi:Legume lectin domain [Dillenia turbinata]|uniref:non-specific serine/threonine protein kinase n=1 Tax=Dillenia turbinata TaxID=194707 RepID=A0AAN8ZJC8_9MAGN